MENKIHPTAIIDKSVKLGSGNEIGPYCVLTGDISLGNGNVFRSHVVMHGHGPINIGNNNDFFSFVAFGVPQDKKFKGENGIINIGNNNTFREYSTVNAGTESGIMKTIIGNNCLFLMSSHVAHDCVLGDEIILSNNVALAGHVEVGDYVIIGGLSAVHQFTRIGKHAMIGGMSAVSGDVIPYGMVVGERAYLSVLPADSRVTYSWQNKNIDSSIF